MEHSSVEQQLEKVKIRRIIGPTPSGAAVLLGNESKTFVIFVGFYEAAALIREINHEALARPLTHELIQSIFLGFDVEVKQVIISSIIDNTFCATLILQQKLIDGNEEWQGKRNEVRIDARPSDCLVLALKAGVDIYVTQEVFEQVQDVSNMTSEQMVGSAGLKLDSLDLDLSPEDPPLGGWIHPEALAGDEFPEGFPFSPPESGFSPDDDEAKEDDEDDDSEHPGAP